MEAGLELDGGCLFRRKSEIIDDVTLGNMVGFIFSCFVFHFSSTSLAGACPRIRRGRAHGACTASARREEEAMSMHIVDDEQRSDRRATPMRPSGSGLEAHLLRWRSSTMCTDIACVAPPCICPSRSQERGPFQFSDRLLGLVSILPSQPPNHFRQSLLTFSQNSEVCKCNS